MKKRYITLSLALLFSVAYGQDKNTAKADKFFAGYQYASAIEEYLGLAESKKANEYVYKQLGNSYYAINDVENASKWYAKAVAGKADAETYFRYAQTLMNKGKYKEAGKQMEVFSSMVPNDSRAIEYKSNPDYISKLAEQKKLFDIKEVNTKNEGKSDFGAFLTNDNKLYFVSNRSKSGKTDKWDNQPYIDIFRCTRDAKGNLTEPESVSELNTPFHDGPVTISEDGKTMFFARDSHSEKHFAKIQSSNIKLGQQGLYKATKVDGKWTQIEPLPINSAEYSVFNPSLSKDGKTLYFASNMPGGFGETDIWKVSVGSNGYGKPENLGQSVNTVSRENFPFIDADNVLYFASNGKLGLGGYDVFKIDLNSGGPAENVGKPVNSEKDDFSFSINKQLNIGYFSSNRKGTDYIYSATPICDAQALVYVSNVKDGKPLANASVALVDSKGKVIDTKQTGTDGKTNFGIACLTEYNVQVSAQNFDPAVNNVKPVKSGETAVNVSLSPVDVIITDTEVILNSIYFEFNKSEITPQGAVELDKLVKVMNDHPTFVIFVKSHTDSKGKADYNLKLSDRRAQSTVQYLISKGISQDRVSGKGFGSTEPKIKCGANCTDEEDAQNRRSEFLIVKK